MEHSICRKIPLALDVCFMVVDSSVAFVAGGGVLEVTTSPVIENVQHT